MKKKGFTLVELMIVIVIIGILAAVAIPKFADMVDKSKEGSTKAQLMAIRGALNVYYSDNEGKFVRVSTSTNNEDDITPTFASVMVPKYLSAIQPAKLPIKNANHSCADVNSNVYHISIPTANVTTSGGWAYDGNYLSSTFGDVRVNCNGQTLDKQRYWTEF